MKRYIVLSVNDNPQYLFYLPLTVWCWRNFGWEPIIFYDCNDFNEGISKLIDNTFERLHDGMTAEMKGHYRTRIIPLEVDDYKSETIAQISRLYGACVVPGDSYLMTGDIDMIPLSDYWNNYNENEITTWGHDLTEFQHVPICYIGMHSSKWKEVMGLTSNDYNALIKRDLDQMPESKSSNPAIVWTVDQEFITQRLSKFDKVNIERGTDPRTGYPIGRVDRSHWTLNHEVFIDAHLPRSAYSDSKSFGQIMNLLTKIWPNEDFQWVKDYTTEFKKLVNG